MSKEQTALNREPSDQIPTNSHAIKNNTKLSETTNRNIDQVKSSNKLTKTVALGSLHIYPYE